MGCFNGTCVITNLPITYGEPTLLFPIVFKTRDDKYPDRHLGGLVYATDVAYPLTFGIEGIYDDYGAIDKIEDSLSLEVLLNGMKCKDFGSLLSDIHDGKASIKDYNGKQAGVGYVLAHKKAVDLLVEQFGRNEDREKAKSMLDLKMFVKESLPGIEDLVKKYNNKAEPNDKLFGTYKYGINLRLGGFDVSLYDSFLDSYIESLGKIRKKRIQKISESLSESHTKYMSFIRGMNCLRRSIFPPCGSGSQSSYLKSQMKLNNIVSEILAEKIMNSDMNEEGMSYVYNVMLGDEDH